MNCTFSTKFYDIFGQLLKLKNFNVDDRVDIQYFQYENDTHIALQVTKLNNPFLPMSIYSEIIRMVSNDTIYNTSRIFEYKTVQTLIDINCKEIDSSKFFSQYRAITFFLLKMLNIEMCLLTLFLFCKILSSKLILQFIKDQ